MPAAQTNRVRRTDELRKAHRNEYARSADQSHVRAFRGYGEGKYRLSVDAREPPNPTTSEEHQRHLQGVLYSTHEGHKRPKRGCYQRREHPGFPGASSVCNILVP
eukprot:1031124-Pyramimonas_sp.AAC.1